MSNALKLEIITNETDYSKIVIGNSKFTDDVWDLSPYIDKKNLCNAFKKLRFEYIKSEDIRFVAKQYAYHQLGYLTPRTVKGKINGSLSIFIEYCDTYNITSFTEITKEIIIHYAEWIKETKNYKSKFKYNCSQVLEEIIKFGQIKGWNVPSEDVLGGIRACDLWNARTLRATNKVKPIPEDIFDKILYYAINKEKNIITKSGIIIQSQTGLRISEVLSIKEGCIHTNADGVSYMEVTISKTLPEPTTHRILVNDLVKDTVKELTLYSEKYRKKLKCKELFIAPHYGGSFPKVNMWTCGRLKTFIEKWDIRGADGNFYPLKSHQFRATFVRELIKKKVPISYIMKQFAHVSVEMTAYYLTLEENDLKQMYGDMLFSKNSKISGLRADTIKNRLNKEFNGKTDMEIKSFISDMVQTMSFNPLPTGVCLYDFMRGNCADGDGCFFYNCPNYITEAKFYPILKQELELMEIEMDRLKLLNRERDWQRQFVKYQYLKPLVESLEAQMDA